MKLGGLLEWKKFFKKFSIFILWVWKYTKYSIYVEKNNLEYVNSGYESTKAERVSASLLDTGVRRRNSYENIC